MRSSEHGVIIMTNLVFCPHLNFLCKTKKHDKNSFQMQGENTHKKTVCFLTN